MSAVNGGVEEVIRSLFEGGQHQYGFPHLGNTEPCDSEHLALFEYHGEFKGEKNAVTSARWKDQVKCIQGKRYRIAGN